jgi:branched-chain amino acid transport system ATP-binding protein
VQERIKAGIARSFQIVNLFDGLSVFDNVALAVFSREGKIVRIAALADHDRTSAARRSTSSSSSVSRARAACRREASPGRAQALDVA